MNPFGGGDRFAIHCEAVRRLLNVHRDGKLSEYSDKPLPALKIANFVGIRVGSSDDSKKKGLRNVVKHLRDHGGMRVCANLTGYWLARDDAEWRAYKEHRKGEAKGEFVHIARMSKAAGEVSSGQTLLPDESTLAWAKH